MRHILCFPTFSWMDVAKLSLRGKSLNKKTAIVLCITYINKYWTSLLIDMPYSPLSHAHLGIILNYKITP